MILYGPPTSSPRSGVAMQEQRSFDFFRARTAGQFAGPFSSELWSKLLPRLSHQEEAIRHAIVAIGALHETAYGAANATTHAEYAMRQYGKAISDVMALNVSRSDAAADIALISCLLFTAFESMQGHYRSALTHSSAGLKILREQEECNRKEALWARDLVKSTFMQLDTQSREIGDVSLRPIDHLPWKSKMPETSFQSLDQAKEWLEIYLRDLAQFLTTLSASLRARPQRIAAILAEHAEKKVLYKAWCVACRDLDSKYASTLVGLPTPVAQGYLIIRIWRTMINIVLSVDIQLAELCWDKFEADFSSVVSMAEHFVRNNAVLDGSPDSSTVGGLPLCKPSMSFSMGFITPLFMTATRCRDPHIRRRACEILRASNRSEAMWSSTLAARIGERVIKLEEATLGSVSSSSQVPLEARIIGMDIEFGPDRQGKIQYYQYSHSAGKSEKSCTAIEEDISWAHLPSLRSCHKLGPGIAKTPQDIPNMYWSSSSSSPL